MTGPARELTARQLDVLKRIAEGQSWERIGSDLGITVGGVGSIGKQILLKLGAVSSAHAVHLAYQAGILRRERHGDHAGFAAHVYRGEDPWACAQGCPEGERVYRAERRRKRRLEAAGGPESRLEPVDGRGEPGGGDRAAQGRTAPRGEAAA